MRKTRIAGTPKEKKVKKKDEHQAKKFSVTLQIVRKDGGGVWHRVSLAATYTHDHRFESHIQALIIE